jgi:predicted transcriptional regulator
LAEDNQQSNAIELATELTIAWLSNPNTSASADDVPSFLQKVHGALNGLEAGPAVEEPAGPEYTPAVTARKSLASKDHIISMIDGKPYKTLRRHLSRHGLTPEQYRERYNLRSDYPMVSDSYSQVRRDMAKKIGLGRKPGETVVPKKPATATKSASTDAAPTAVPVAKTAAPKKTSARKKATASTSVAPKKPAAPAATTPAKRGRKANAAAPQT